MQLAATLLTVSLNVGIALTVFAYALRAGSEDFRFVLRERRLIALSLLSIFVITPAIALCLRSLRVVSGRFWSSCGTDVGWQTRSDR